nr:hypothetical protein BaRGS_029433 [Batillaria attramentaria]
MNRYHLGKVADLMRQEGWTVDFDNMAAVFFMQPQYFFVAQTLSGDIVAVDTSSRAWVPECSGKPSDALGGRAVCFYSVEDAIPFYERRGFQTRRFQALVRDFCLDPLDFASDYLRNWIVGCQNVSFVAVDADSGNVVGYVALSLANGRWDLNPLYADSDEVATQLLKRAAEQVGEPIRLFVRIPCRLLLRHQALRQDAGHSA